MPVDGLAALAARYAADLALIDAGRGAARRRSKPPRTRPSERYRARCGERSRRRARKAAEQLDKAVNAELKPLKLERAQVLDPDRQRAGRAPARTASTASSSGCRPIRAPGPAR